MVVAKTVPTVLGAMVSSTLLSNSSGLPWPTQSASLGSPRYSLISLYLSSESILYVLDWHTGSGTHASSEKDMRGSQPPRQ